MRKQHMNMAFTSSCLVYIVIFGMLLSVTYGGVCNPWSCRSLPCSEPVKLPGNCCPVCPCYYRGRYYNVGDLVFTSNHCVTCECTKYGIECLPFPCPRAICHNPIKRRGECCPECGCMVQGVFIEMGYQVISNNPCDDCRCGYDGKVRCSNIDCPRLTCENPYSVPGVCCKKCGCRQRDGKTFDFGALPITDRCRPCTCQRNGTITCEEPVCPEKNCTRRKQYTPEGECCPKCGCLYQETFYFEGDEMPIPAKEKCAERCYCGTDGEMICDAPDCPDPDCPNPVVVPGECCPQCGCLGNRNKLIEIGPILDDPCQPCECQMNGNITCAERQLCPDLQCVSGFYKPNSTEEQECCPKCKCKFAGKNYRPSERFVGPKCMQCECHQFTGRVSCEKADCSTAQLQCSNPTIKRGQCCPSCPNGPACSYQKNVITYGQYRTFGKLVCVCLGDPWFPNAFCAPKDISPDITKQFDKRWMKFGYDAAKPKKQKKQI